MATMRSVWGFGHIQAVTPEGTDAVNPFCKALNAAAKSRGIEAHIESDALDLSRDLMIDEAAHSIGMDWKLADDTLRLWPVGVTVNWSTITP